jgi:hypothetical protein
MSDISSILFDKDEDYNVEICNTECIYEKLICYWTKIKNDKTPKNTSDNYYIFPNFINNYLCDFIVNECEKYSYTNISIKNPKGWTTSRHFHYPTNDLPINDINSINTIIQNIVVLNIFPLIEQLYNVNKYLLCCKDIFVVKYEESGQNKLEKHLDGSLFSFNILLNHTDNFKGGGTIFHKSSGDELVLNTKGGLLLHPGYMFHSGNTVLQGKRYILVGFIDYLKNIPLISKNPKILESQFNDKNIILNKSDNEMNLKTWTLSIDETYQQKLNDIFEEKIFKVPRDSYILDTSKTQFNIIEKIVYELSIFHLKQMNLEVDFDRYKIELWCKNNYNQLHNLHCDKDEPIFMSQSILKFPILSTVTYINESFYPLLITNTDGYSKGEQVVLKNGVTLIFPKPMTHIAFNGQKLHGVFDIYTENDLPKSNRKSIMFNIWDTHSPNEFNNNTNYFELVESSTQLVTNISKTDTMLTKTIKIKENEMEIFIKSILWNENNINKIISEIYDKNKYGLIYNNNIVEFDI